MKKVITHIIVSVKFLFRIKNLLETLTGIDSLLKADIITFDKWVELHGNLVDEYLIIWFKIIDYIRKEKQGGEHEQDN